MDKMSFYEMILDNISHGIYVLDDVGNYLFVNSAYLQLLNMPKSTLLGYNVYEFLRTKQINISIADIVYREKRRVVMFQDVYDTQKYGRKTFRLLVESVPVFNNEGKVQNIISTVRTLDAMEVLYSEASDNKTITQLTPLETKMGDQDAIIAASPSMRDVLSVATIVATVDSAILISGESGTGKEVIAHYIHQQSPRKDHKMVIINCASLPASLLEAELFGYEKGAFTGALPGGKKGLIEEANKSSLFLDEVNSLPLDLQGKLLRAIESKTIQRVGSTKTIEVDFRLIAATNENLANLVKEKRFRADLYYRLDVIPILLPPLRDRKEDIIPLANHFLYYFCKKHNKSKAFTQNTLSSMMRYDWPGNVRHLKNFVERSVVVSIGEEIEISDVEHVIGGRSIRSEQTNYNRLNTGNARPSESRFFHLLEDGVSLDEYMEQCEKDYLAFALKKYTNTYKTAEALGTTQSTIMRRKKKYSL